MGRVKSFKFNNDRQSQAFARRVIEALERTINRAKSDAEHDSPCPNCGDTSCSAKGKGACDYAQD